MSRTILTAFMLLVAATPATAQWWQYVDQLEFAPTEEVTILAVLDGTGPPLTEARTADGTVVDATIRLRIVTDDHTPLIGYPGEDIWLEFPPAAGPAWNCIVSGGNPHPAVFQADTETDSDGWATFSLPWVAGGWSAGPATLYIAGSRAEWFPSGAVQPLAIRINSPDLSGDRHVNLADLNLYAQDYIGSYHFRSDLVFDSVLNLSDVSVFARHYGTACN